MRLIEIKQLENGAHLNQTISALSTIPEGWAVIPEDMVCANFPFGEVTAEEVAVEKEVIGEDGEVTIETEYVMTVTNWVPGEIPVPEEMPEEEPTPELEEVTWDTLAEAYREGVNSID